MRVMVLGWRSTLASYLVTESHYEGLWSTNFDVRSAAGFSRAGDADVIINCAAVTEFYHHRNPGYTRLDRPLRFQGTYSQRIFQVNAQGAANAAIAARVRGAYLIHVSCDRVMGTDGPYYDTQEPYPQDDLAFSKYSGELAVRAIMQDHPYVIVRLPWLYGARYHKGFPVVAVNRKTPAIADGDKGMPVHGRDAARKLLALVSRAEGGKLVTGTIHVGWKGKSPISWYDFLEPYYPHVEPASEASRVRVVRGLIPSGEEWAVGDGMDVFQPEIARHPLWAKRDTKKP